MFPPAPCAHARTRRRYPFRKTQNKSQNPHGRFLPDRRAQGALARDRRRRLHRLSPGRIAGTGRPVGDRHRRLLDRQAGQHRRHHGLHPSRRTERPAVRGRDHLRPRLLQPCRRGRGLRAAPGRPGLRAPLDEDPAGLVPGQRLRLHGDHRRRPPGRGEVLRLRLLQLGLRRPSRPAQGGKRHRQRALALRRHQGCRRTVRRHLCALLRHARGRHALFQRLRCPSGRQRRLCCRHPALDRHAAAPGSSADQRRRPDQPRLLLHRQRGAGQHPRRPHAGR